MQKYIDMVTNAARTTTDSVSNAASTVAGVVGDAASVVGRTTVDATKAGYNFVGQHGGRIAMGLTIASVIAEMATRRYTVVRPHVRRVRT